MLKSERNYGEITILLPSLNARRFLDERVTSLLAQTYQNWRAIVLDSHSTDGTWEFFNRISADDSRFELHQVPREGLYSALNRGIDMAKGEFLHIATCDDTMEPDFLRISVDALRESPEAGIAVTDLRFIDDKGNDDVSGRFGSDSVRTSHCGEIMSQFNLRPVPHDFLLHLSLQTVYFSLTQLVVRREAVTAFNYFDTAAGSSADFGWSMNLCKSNATVHIPEKLATWRHHGNQLSLVPDSSRTKIISHACIEAMASTDILSEKYREFFLLPARKEISGDRTFYRFIIVIKCIVILILTLFSNPKMGIRGLKAARFGYFYLRTSWISYLMNYLEIEGSRYVTTT